MKDLTERKLVYLDDAIDAVNSLCDDCDSGYCGDCRVNIYLGGGVRKVLEALPSAQPERKTGKWLTSDDFYETGICSRCKWDSQEPISYAVTNFNFCPNCGADMRGEQDG